MNGTELNEHWTLLGVFNHAHSAKTRHVMNSCVALGEVSVFCNDNNIVNLYKKIDYFNLLMAYI